MSEGRGFLATPGARLPLSRLLMAGACGCLLFAILFWHRSHLIPGGADAERAHWLLSGDEPGYLLLAQAIAAGDGLDLRPAHERGSYLKFQQRPVIGPEQWTWEYYRSLGFKPWLDRSRSWGNRQLLPRLPVFPAVIATFVEHTDNLRRSVGLFQSLFVSIAAIACVWFCTAGNTRENIHAATALLVTLGGLPVAYYTTQVYPETLAGALLLGAFALYARGGRGANLAGNLLLVLGLWTTPRVTAGILAASAVLLARDWRGRHGAGIAALLLGWTAFLLWNLWVWGDLLLPNANPGSRNNLASLPGGTLRFFLGNDVGLLFLSPVLWVGLVAGTVNVIALRKHIDIAWAALFTGVLVVVASFPDARAGTCPAGRYQVIPAYLLVFPLIRLLAKGPAAWKRRLAPLVYLLGVPGLVMSLAVATHPTYWFRSYHPLFGFARLQRYYDLLPPDRWPALLWTSLAWLALLVLSLFLPRLTRRRE